MSDRHARSWSDFWAADAAAGGGSGCLPEGYRGIQAAQQSAWRRFAADLPKGARFLDLATGDGRVMAWIMAARRDAKAFGCDLAPRLPEPPRGARVKAGVPMEALPYPDGRFAAATSQFGFEYSDTGRSAAEVARVVTTGGRIGLLMHRGDGPILAHNLKRRAQIAWALEERDLVNRAKDSLKSRAIGIAAIPQDLVAAPAEGARIHGPQSAAWEIAEAVRQTLHLGARDHPANVARTLDTIAGKAANELGRIESLEAACRTADDTRKLEAGFAAAGLAIVSRTPVCEDGESAPFATFWELTRPD